MKRTFLFRFTALTICLALSFVGSSNLFATTDVVSDNGHPWDVIDTTDSDNGGISDGGNDAFDDWGLIRIRTMDISNAVLTSDDELSGFGLTYDGGRRFVTTTPQTVDDIQVSRAMYTPTGTDYMRYIDTFTNTGASVRQFQIAWGGNLGSDSGTTVSATGSGDLSITTADAWVLTIEEDNSNDPTGPATDPPVGYVFQDLGTGQYSSAGAYSSTPFDTPWGGDGNDNISFVFGPISLNAGESVSLAYFLYRGLEENTDGPLGQTPVGGEEIAAAIVILTDLAANPDFGDLSPGELDSIINWSANANQPSLPSVPIPTLSQWALILLSLMIGFMAFARQRKPS